MPESKKIVKMVTTFGCKMGQKSKNQNLKKSSNEKI